MREQTIKMIELAAATAVFISACWFSYDMQAEIDGGLEAANRMVQDQSAGVTTHLMISGADQLTLLGSEVLFMLREVQQEKYDMSVDGVVFPKGIDPESADLTMIEADARYRVHYSFGPNGEIDNIQHSKVR